MKTVSMIPLNQTHWHKLRAPNLNSTEISALFGLDPYLTLFELWHRKKGAITVDFEENERTIWGKRLETSIALGIAEDEKWNIRPMSEYIYDPEKKIGSSFDFAINNDGLLEIKNVDALIFRDGWIVGEEGIEAPPHIEMQVQVQMAVSERSLNYIGCLVGGNRINLIKREPDERVIKAIFQKVEQFWNTIADNEAPKPDFSRDADTIRALYSQSVTGKVLDMIGDSEAKVLIERYRDLSSRKKDIESRIDEVKSKLLIKAGDAEKCFGENFSISLSVVKGSHVEYDRAEYRQFRINLKKEVQG